MMKSSPRMALEMSYDNQVERGECERNYHREHWPLAIIATPWPSVSVPRTTQVPPPHCWVCEIFTRMVVLVFVRTPGSEGGVLPTSGFVRFWNPGTPQNASWNAVSLRRRLEPGWIRSTSILHAPVSCNRMEENSKAQEELMATV